MTVVVNTLSRRERRKSETTGRIVNAAVQVFSRFGIDHATVDQIAAEADVGKGTIYNYFSSKDEIVVAFLAGIEREVERRAPEFAHAEGSLDDLLLAFLRFQLQLKEPHLDFVRVFFVQVFARGSARSRWMRALQATIDPPLLEFFSVLRRRGLIRSDLALNDLVQLFKMLHVGIMTVWVMEGPPWHGTQHLLQQQIRIFCHGIAARETT